MPATTRTGAVDYAVRVLLPILIVVVGGVASHVRLQGEVDAAKDDIREMKAQLVADDAVLDALKIDQVKLNGKIDTLNAMMGNLAKTAERIEQKLDENHR